MVFKYNLESRGNDELLMMNLQIIDNQYIVR